MTAREAELVMHDGKRVRRPSWYLGRFWFRYKGSVHESDPRRVGWLQNPEVHWVDAVADDWEIYEPPVPRYIQMQLSDDVPEGYEGKYEIGEDGKVHPAIEYE